MAVIQIFKNIDELVTLDHVYQKSARHIIEKDLVCIKKGAMIVRSGKILWVGKTAELKMAQVKRLLKGHTLKEKSLAGTTVLPAFVECHTHTVFAGDRSAEFEQRNRGVSYQEIANQGGGILSTVKATRKASEKKLVELAQQRVNRFVRQGVTALEIKSGYALNQSGELKMLRVIRQLSKAKIMSTFLGPHALPPEFQTTNEYLDHLINSVLPKVVRGKLADRIDMFVESGYFSCEQARRWIDTAQRSGLGATLHVDQLTNNQGCLVGVDRGIQSVDHLVQVNKADIQKIAHSQVTGVLLPGADMYLKMSYPPARDLIDAGACVALATDFNPGSCPTQDLSLIGVLARLEMKMSLPEVLAAYTQGAAYALGLDKERGSLSIGKACDFVTIDGSWRDLFYQVGYHPVNGVWREGKKIV